MSQKTIERKLIIKSPKGLPIPKSNSYSQAIMILSGSELERYAKDRYRRSKLSR